MKSSLVSVVLFAFLCPLAAQGGAPLSCECSLLQDDWPIHDSLVGDADTTAVCQVASPGTPCRVVGTISFDYNPDPVNYTFWSANWGMPTTFFTPTESALNTFTHPSTGTTAECDSGNTVWSQLTVQGAAFGGPYWVVAFRKWGCVSN